MPRFVPGWLSAANEQFGVMQTRIFANLVLLSMAAFTPYDQARAQPHMKGAVDRPECQAAIKMAEKAFYSTEYSLFWPVPAPDESAHRIVLSRKIKDISGGDALEAAPDVFVRKRNRELSAETVIFWQRSAADGKRFVVLDSPFSWRGHWYHLFVVDGHLGVDEFVQDIRNGTIPDPILGRNRWQPPILLQSLETEGLWILDQGERGIGLSPWKVLFLGKSGVTKTCQIEFSTEQSLGLSRMPPSVRKFAALTDQALGPGRNEGTLQPTQQIRNRVAGHWTILSKRPWAFEPNPANTREEIETGLAQWAAAHSARADLLQDMIEEYGHAERELAQFFVSEFDIAESDARDFSAYAMDIMLRSYFVFHREDRGRSELKNSPWPNDIR